MKTKLLQFVQESRKLLPHATTEQKIRLLKIIKESIKNNKSQNTVIETKEIELPKNSDYLEEK